MTTNLIITGAAGRMGRVLVQCAHASKNHKVVGATEAPTSPFTGKDVGSVAGIESLGVVIGDSLGEVLQKNRKFSPVIIDFTMPIASEGHARDAVENGTPMVIGTTGFADAQKKIIQNAAKKIPIVMAPNMSVGVNALFKLVSDAARILGGGYDLEILEAHHRLKKDAPSGTAVRLAEILAKATGRKYPKDARFNRVGVAQARTDQEIGLQVLRGGDIVGEHTVFYCGEGERLELKHVATSRKTFAEGALRAAHWLEGKKSGLYTMEDVLGIA